MRFTSLTKWRSSGQMACKRSSSSSRTNPNRGRGLNCQSRDAVQQTSTSNWGPRSLASSQHLASTVTATYSSRFRVLMILFQNSRLLLTTKAEPWPWRTSANGNCHKRWHKPVETISFWNRLYSYCHPNILRSLHSGKQARSERSYATFSWRPAMVLILADNKGQVVMRSLGKMIGGASSSPDTSMSLPVPVQNNRGLNSLNRRSPVLFGHPAVFLMKTVDTMWIVLRALYLLGLFMPCIFLSPFAEAFGGRVYIFWLDLVLSTLESAGPAFIKWGQWAATRPDVFPQDVCNVLSKLQMQAPSHSFQQTREICESAFRARLEDVFEEFSVEPVASGSIAQVHKAVLKRQSSSERAPQYVAVKVRHPDVGRAIQRDFVIITWLAYISTLLPGLPHLQLDRTVQQFASFMTKQVDLTLEAAHLLRFIYNFRRIKNVTFPTPIYPWVHPSVLVETYEEGESITTIVELMTDLTKSHSQLAYIGSRALLKMLLKDNFVHGDLHPGNIFVRFAGNRPNVVLLDVGLTAELNQRNRSILLELFKAVAAKDGFRAAQWTLQFSKDQSCPDPQGFARDVDAKFKEYLAKRGTQYTAKCLNDLFDQVRRHRVNMDGDVCTVMVTTLILEGWQRKLDPDLDIIKMVGDLFFKQEWAVPYEYALAAIAAP